MEVWLRVIIGIMAFVILALFIKIRILQKAAKEIETAFADKLRTETNTLIDISTNDKYMKSLAKQINAELCKLCSERHRFQQGDMELKNAVTSISHDLRTPLTAICGYLDLLEREETSESGTRYIEVIRNRTELLRQLIEELFRYSVILADEQLDCTEPVVLNHVLEDSIAAFYPVLQEKGITPNIKISDCKVTRTLNYSALLRVFSNLLHNSLKYSDGDLEIVLTEAGEIRFTNTASGLNEVQIGKLFDRFYTVDNAQNSTGLGLSIAKTLVLQMGGTITAAYENNRLGIIVCFPVQNAEMCDTICL